MSIKRRARDIDIDRNGMHGRMYKRVHLRYESEGDIDDELGVAEADDISNVPHDYQIAEYPSDLDTSKDTPEDPHDHEAHFKHQPRKGVRSGKQAVISAQPNHYATRSRGTRANDATGQRPALGSLSFQWEDGYGDDEDEGDRDSASEEAMAYLRSVRTERQGMAPVFRAPDLEENDAIYDSGVGDTRGFCEDGAYISRGGATSDGPGADPSSTLEPIEAFTTALKVRFLSQRAQLHAPLSADSLRTSELTQPFRLHFGDIKGYKEWHGTHLKQAPVRAQLKRMDQDTVVRILRLIQKSFLVRQRMIPAILSSWIWSLLSRLDDVGMMNNERVYEVREFGKKALLVQLSFNNAVGAEHLERASRDDDNASPASEQSMDGTASVLQTQAESQSVQSSAIGTASAGDESDTKQNTLATLDMIIVVVGDIFGQRDLLEFRQSWSQATAALD